MQARSSAGPNFECEVANVKKATKKAKSLGAKIKKDVTEVKGAGPLSIITDPTGAMLGLWEPKRKKKKSCSQS
jgi:predicted enzyme related to lactoylglutathione lyase